MKAFYDVDTQNDFMNKDGKLYVPGAEQLKSNLEKITNYAIEYNILLLGSVDRHFEDDIELNIFPKHCMDGTEGQKKIPETFYEHGISYVPSKLAPHGRYEEQSANDINIITRCYDQIIFEKQTTDVFTNRNFQKYLDKLRISEVVVYGVATEYCVKDAVMGFLEQGIKVTVIENAIKGIDETASKMAIEEMKSAGVKFVSMESIIKI